MEQKNNNEQLETTPMAIKVAIDIGPDEAKEILVSEGIKVEKKITEPKREGKKPREVWQVYGHTGGLEQILYGLGCSRRRWKGAFSFWEGDPSLEIAKAIKEKGRLSFAEQQKNTKERAEKRAERFEGYSKNAAKRSDTLCEESMGLIGGIPFGQPILVGHHSAKRHRGLLDRSNNKMRKSIEEQKKSEYFEHKANATLLNIERKEVSISYIENKIKQSKEYLEKVEEYKKILPSYHSRKKDAEEKVSYYENLKKSLIQEAAENGEIIPGKGTVKREDVKKGNFVKYEGIYYPVLRVNKKTVTTARYLNSTKPYYRIPFQYIEDVKQSVDKIMKFYDSKENES